MTWLKLQLKAYFILFFHCSIAWCSDIHFATSFWSVIVT
jgi:hypothetical protein